MAGDALCPQDLRNLTVFDSALTKTMFMSFFIAISSNYKIGTDFKKISSNTLRLDEREPRKCALGHREVAGLEWEHRVLGPS